LIELSAQSHSSLLGYQFVVTRDFLKKDWLNMFQVENLASNPFLALIVLCYAM
jgi:hypothetical protein